MNRLLLTLSLFLIPLAAKAADLTVKWNYTHTTETGFKIERAPAGPTQWVTWTQITTVPWNTKRYTDTGLANNTQYQYRMRAYNGSGDSPYSNVMSKVTPRTSWWRRWVSRNEG